MFHDFDQKDDIYRSEIKIPTDLSRNTNPLLAFQIQYQPPPPPQTLVYNNIIQKLTITKVNYTSQRVI